MMKTSAKCVVCHGYTQYRCAGCGLSFYCTPQHQRQDWPSHRAECLASQGDPQGRRTRKLRRVVPLSPVAKDSSEGAGEQGADAGLLERTPDGRQVQLDPDALEALLTSGIPLADARRALAKFGGEDSGSAWEWLQDGHARGTVEVHDFALETEGMLDDIGHSEVEMLLREHRGPADMPPDQCSTAAAGAANQRRPSTPPGAIVSLIAMMPDPMLRLVYDCNVTISSLAVRLCALTADHIDRLDVRFVAFMEGLRLNLRIHHSQMTIVAQVHLNDSMKHDYASVFDRVEKLIPELTIRLPGAPSSSSFPLLALHVGSADRGESETELDDGSELDDAARPV